MSDDKLDDVEAQPKDNSISIWILSEENDENWIVICNEQACDEEHFFIRETWHWQTVSISRFGCDP